MKIEWLLGLYPPRWRERYGEEMLALLEQHSVTWRTVLDLLGSALDARLDPYFRPLPTPAEMVRRMRRAHCTTFWAFPLLIAGYLYLLDGLDDALYEWNRAHAGLWHFKLSSEIALGVALFSFLLIALPVVLAALITRYRISTRVFRFTLPSIALIVLGLTLHILYTAVWGYAIWSLPTSTVQQMTVAANRHIWSGDGWHLQIVGGVLWMGLITGYIGRCLLQSFRSLRHTQTPDANHA